MICALPLFRGFDLIICSSASADTAHMGVSNLGGITVCGATVISFWIYLVVIAHMS